MQGPNGNQCQLFGLTLGKYMKINKYQCVVRCMHIHEDAMDVFKNLIEWQSLSVVISELETTAVN